jgi:hypothetical protein
MDDVRGGLVFFPAMSENGMNGSRPLPHSLEAEEYLLSCCLLDGAETVARCIDARLKPESFYDPKHGIIFDHLVSLHDQRKPIDISVIAEELKSSRQLDQVGGYAFLAQVSSRIPTTAQAGYFIDKVREQSLLREIIRSSLKAVEKCYNFSGGIDEFLVEQKSLVDRIGEIRSSKPIRSLDSFQIPPDNDRSILLGNRFLNRGDGGVLSSTSGVGKSSISVQKAVLWSLGRPAFGIVPNGELRSLMVQSEDSDGDIAEVWASMVHGLKLGEEERKLVGDRVKIATNRTHRGKAFIAWLRRQIALHKPDIVWLNPLQAFIDGDLKDSRDIGNFLREGLNSLNEKEEFGYIIVHHTTKPPQAAADRKDRQWNEVMYDMAGGAEIINWARFIMSLRARDEEGKFDLILAKRGRRAGVTVKVPQGAAEREEIITTIPLRHSTARIEIPGRSKPLNAIFWEEGEKAVKKTEPRKPAKDKNDFPDFAIIFPVEQSKAANLATLHRLAMQVKPIGKTTLYERICSFVEQGAVIRDDNFGVPRYWRKLTTD